MLLRAFDGGRRPSDPDGSRRLVPRVTRLPVLRFGGATGGEVRGRAERARQAAARSGRLSAVAARILVIDTYDSFVYNLVQYLGELGADPIVHRNDALTVDEAMALEPDAVLLSPGPGRPEDAGISAS